MIGLIIVTHSALGQEMLATLQHVTGEQPYITAIGMAPEDNPETCLEEIKQEIKKLDQGHGVVIATDLFGGTPSNLGISVMEPGKIEVMAGVNMPTLIKFVSVRKQMSITKAIETALEAGKKYMVSPSGFL